MKAKTIFRTNKNKDNPYVMMDKRPIENVSLSWKAKGILSYLLSRPDDWTIQIGDLINKASDGEMAVRTAVKELIDAGHIVRRYERENGKIKRVTLEVYEQPLCDFLLVENLKVENLQVEKQDVENLHLENLHVGNHPLNNNDSTNNESNNSDVKNKSSRKQGGRDTRLDHPAIVGFKQVSRLNVPIIWRDDVIKTVGEDQEQIEKWLELVKSWVGRSYNPGNIEGMLKAFTNGGLKQNNGTGHKTTKEQRIPRGV